MLTFGRDHFFALDDEMNLDRDGLRDWLAKHAGGPVLVFGFTFMVWEHLIGRLEPGEADLGDAVLIHSGGWKKLADQAVDNEAFKAEVERVSGLRRVHNFYGMAEQIGTVFVECEHGLLHAPDASDVIVRDPATWRPVARGETGVAQMLSALPESYPGHSILTEDLARVDAVDDCGCGRLGQAITVLGRVPKAELRGCSDTHAQDPSPRDRRAARPAGRARRRRGAAARPARGPAPERRAVRPGARRVQRRGLTRDLPPPARPGVAGTGGRRVLAPARRGHGPRPALRGAGGGGRPPCPARPRLPPAADQRRHALPVLADDVPAGRQPQRRARLARRADRDRSRCCARR